ncbi:hypothetical protein ACIA8O_20610 [Kitasatospora sp. NPDC051853]|uniref:hypothetical protein n=1 Tax=Kitasatospora sp. NPDC051853 TaxID=3364058 RepID=UPI003796DB8B
MTERRRWPALFVLAGLLALAAYAWGVYEDRPGGRTMVAVALFRPLIVGGAGLAFLAVTAAARSRNGRTVAGLVAACTLLYAVGALVLQGAVPQQRVTSRQPRPGVPGHVLVVTQVGNPGSEIESQSWKLNLHTGSGWSERHWWVAELPASGRDGTFASATWADRGHVLVTTDKGTRTIAVPAP